jgi:hypothetical protein
MINHGEHRVKMKKTSLFLVVFIAAVAVLYAQTVPDGLLYTNVGKNVTITRYVGSATTLVLPSSIGGRSVTAIGIRAFLNRNDLQSVTLPNTLTTIELRAFSGCSSLQSITLPDTVTTIGAYAFNMFTALRSVTLSAALTRVGSNAFAYTDVRSITLPSSLRIIGNDAFTMMSLQGSLTIPNGVTTIGGNAFSYNGYLLEVIIPESVTSIGYCAFGNCVGLRNVTMSRSTHVGDDTFPAGVTFTYR